MNKSQIEARKQHGREIAERLRIEQKGGVWVVPSSKSGRKYFEVSLGPTNASCTCPDHEEGGHKCKNIFAVKYIKGQNSGGSAFDIAANTASESGAGRRLLR